MAYQFRTQRKIEFSDTDMAGIVHFSRYFVFMETAEHEFLKSLGTGVITHIKGDKISWPRLSAAFDFYAPMRFEDVVDIEILIARKGNKSVTYQCVFKRGGTLIARGKIVAVCCVCNQGEPVRAIAIPEEIADLIEEAPASELEAHAT